MLTRRQALIRAAAAQQTFPPASQPATRVNFAVPPGASSYGADNSCLLDALHRLGSRARGVVVVTDKTSDAQLDEWDRAGVRGTRLSGGEGISASPDDRKRLQAAVQRLAGRRWHGF
jgi:predicted TIM-barrel fold metal-dependent hydrolase